MKGIFPTPWKAITTLKMCFVCRAMPIVRAVAVQNITDAVSKDAFYLSV